MAPTLGAIHQQINQGETVMKTLLWIFAALILSLPTFATAQSGVYIGFNTGTLNPTEENAFSDAGFAFGASITAVNGGWLGYGVSYLGAINGETSLGGDTSFQSGAFDLKMMAPIHGRGQTGFTPYVRGGIGLYQFKAEIFGTTAETGVNAQIPVGAGFLLDLNEQVAIGGDFAYHILFDANFDEDPERSDIDAWDATANLVFKL
jgi:hypothetical protein